MAAGVVLSAVVLLGCPLPFQFSPQGYASGAAANDPSTPSISARPVLAYGSSGGSGTLSDGGEAATSADTTMTLSSETVGAVIYYTTNGTTPDPHSSTTMKYQPGSPLTLKIGNPTTDNASISQTVMAVAIGPNMKPSLVSTFTVRVSYPQAATPTFSLAGGAYTADQLLELSSQTAGATIYYTMVASGTPPQPVPGQAGTYQYTGPINLTGPSSTSIIKAIAVKAEMLDSSPSAACSYTISYPLLASPTFNPAGDTYSNDITVTISSESGSTIWYTTDGSEPQVGMCASIDSGSSLGFTGGTTTIRAIAAKQGMNNSAESSATYAFKVATPVASVPAGQYNSVQTVTLTTATTGAQIYYTTNGNAPTTSDTPYTGPITVSTTTTIKAIAIRTMYQPSAISTNTYELRVAPTTFSPAGGWYSTGPIDVSLANATPGAEIHYTTDGNAPTTASTVYNGTPIHLDMANGTQTTIRTIATFVGFSDSIETTATYSLVMNVLPVVGIATSSTMQISVTIPAGTSSCIYSLTRLDAAGQNGVTVASGQTGSATFTDTGLASSTGYQYYISIRYPDANNYAKACPKVQSMTLDSNNLPPIVSVTITNFTAPSGYTPVFYVAADSFDTTTTASMGLRQGGYLFVPYGSRTDNGYTVIVRTFDCNGAFVKDTTASGNTRYLWKVEVNTDGTITYTGQSNGTATINWSALKM